jgi:predicted nucleic acid-binding protein
VDGRATRSRRVGRSAVSRSTLMLVIDATVAFDAAQSPDGFSVFGSEDLVAPPLMWSEARSSLHEAIWRREMSTELGRRSLDALEDCPVRARTHRRLGRRAVELADAFGWAKTYDAEYLALAELLGCRLVTTDSRMYRRVGHLDHVVRPQDILQP